MRRRSACVDTTSADEWNYAMVDELMRALEVLLSKSVMTDTEYDATDHTTAYLEGANEKCD